MLEAIDNPLFVDSMKDKLNPKTGEDMIRERIEALEKSRSQVAGAKSKLFEQMDRLDITDEFYDDKYADMQARVDKLYREIAELDREINKAEQDLKVVFEGKATMETAYQVLQVVKEKYGMLADTEKKKLMNELLERVEIFEERQKDGRLDLTAEESKSTYEEIKAYVKYQTGLQVSNFYIAQVMRMCGIVERENYNLPK